LGKGDNLTVYNAFADLTKGDFDLQLEYFGSDNQHGVSTTTSSKGSAYSIQPAYKFNDKIEGVVRYTKVDSDGRGVNISDGIRSAPSGGTMNKMADGTPVSAISSAQRREVAARLHLRQIE